ncbi:hypothetical protein PoB_001215500 [Plakobranchus ocellatus]|uniref:Uncharacterized protein n=1 Tax=Plakobranchus ocellatus TaxID=259542 RepID=A0AAV3YSA2_9GAST|nr:hypothetical protein PoB_001215500 [Plakobranchus ocellatus]
MLSILLQTFNFSRLLSNLQFNKNAHLAGKYAKASYKSSPAYTTDFLIGKHWFLSLGAFGILRTLVVLMALLLLSVQTTVSSFYNFRRGFNQFQCSISSKLDLRIVANFFKIQHCKFADSSDPEISDVNLLLHLTGGERIVNSKVISHPRARTTNAVSVIKFMSRHIDIYHMNWDKYFESYAKRS